MSRRQEPVKPKSEGIPGFVVSRFGAEADVELENGETIRCHLRRKLETLVCGDNVLCELKEAGKGVVVEALPRQTVLKRPIRYQGLKAVAANLDQLCIVVAPEPEFSEMILDKYLAAAELAGIPATIIFNKTDLPIVNDELKARLNCYQTLEYPLIFTSVKSGVGMEQLAERLHHHTSVFVGQSGVGKSSLVNYLLPTVQAEVNQISDNSGLGTHTTTASRLYHFGDQGRIIDSPGIRDFSMEHIAKDILAQGFKEIHNHAAYCKFRNCLHLNEPNCDVKAAVESGLINAGRYQRYLKILAES